MKANQNMLKDFPKRKKDVCTYKSICKYCSGLISKSLKWKHISLYTQGCTH